MGYYTMDRPQTPPPTNNPPPANEPPPSTEPPPNEPDPTTPPTTGGPGLIVDTGDLAEIVGTIPDIVDSATDAVGDIPGFIGDLADAIPGINIGTEGLLDIDASSGDGSIDIDVGTPSAPGLGGILGGATDLIGLQADSDAQIVVPLFPGADGEGGVLPANGLGGATDLIGLQADSDAQIVVPLFPGADGEGGVLPANGLGGATDLIGLQADSEAEIVVPLFPGADGQGGVLAANGGLGGATDLIGFQAGGDAVVNIPLVDAEGNLAAGGGDIGSLLNAAMLNAGGNGSLGSLIGGDVYDGNVPLAGDLSSALGSTLDLLTTTSSLFDVPVLDILGSDGLDG